jgi:hypothetical protein
MKTCSKCSGEKDTNHSYCRSCLSEYDRARWNSKDPTERNRKNSNRRKRVARQRTMIDKIKLDAGCIDCGYNEHAIALDFDHIGRDKSFNIGQASNRGFTDQTILDEIAKCVVRCANCHRVKTKERRINGV